ncbi:MAG: response regulator transcription factor [Anaerolineaceae bacterium]|nr:response regulator transcription factor [Anaerolineaceae bacterium]
MTQDNMESPVSVGVDLDELDTAQRQRVLVVDDEMDTIFLLKQILRIAGFNVLSASNGEDALNKLAERKPDLVLLDLMMPEMDGWETFSYMREMMEEVPVIIVTAKGTKKDVVKGLKAGADDYIPKPFYNDEVAERVKAVLRRTGTPKELSKLVFPQVELTIDMNSQEVEINEESVRLTPKEFAVLSLLAKHSPAIVSYETIAHEVWGEDSPDVRRRTKYVIYLLRRKFETLNPDIDLIINIDRLGYKLQTEIE